jgi:hypothetical protein
MTTLRFHKGLYSVEALSAAAAAFEPFAAIARKEEPEHFVVELTCREVSGDEAAMAGEFSNYVLGGTVDRAPQEGQPS